MGPLVANQSIPSVSIPGATMPAVAVQTINHQAAGLDLGCANCSTAAVALKDAASPIPKWAVILGGLTFVAIVVSILGAVAGRRPRRS